MTELPLVIINVQRGGPSTGLPTKTEQSDLFQAVYGRNGEAPIPVLAPTTPGDCYHAAYEACRIAVKYMSPVMVLSDGYLVNGSEPWLIPNPDDLQSFNVEFAKEEDAEDFLPYKRNPETLARSWAIPGTKGLEHRIGGLEKQDITGNVNYDSDNHQKMVEIRAQKIANIANEIPPTEIFGESKGDVLILSWGSGHGASRAATESLLSENIKVGHDLDEGSQMGPVSNQAQYESNLEYVEIGKKEAKLIHGGNPMNMRSSGYYMEPTLFIDGENQSRINQEEMFGPIACVIPCKDLEHGLEIANDTQFGLSSGVITTSLAKAEHFKKNIKTGVTTVNLPTAGLDYHVPFGGRKASSFGLREQGTYAKEFYTQIKTSYINAGSV